MDERVVEINMFNCPICNNPYQLGNNFDPTYTIYKCANCGDFFFLESMYNYDTFNLDAVDPISLKEKVVNYSTDNYTLFIVGNTQQIIKFETTNLKNHFLSKGYKNIITIIA